MQSIRQRKSSIELLLIEIAFYTRGHFAKQHRGKALGVLYWRVTLYAFSLQIPKCGNITTTHKGKC
jgi:hypothetical protein